MSDREVRIASGIVGKGEYAGVCFTAVPLVVDASSPEEAIAKVRAFTEELHELTEAHDGLRMSRGTAESIFAMRAALVIAEAEAAKQARRQ